MGSSKAKGLRRHAKRRAYERYGIVIGNSRLEKVVKAIQRNKGKFIQRYSNRVTEWEVTLEEEVCRVLYDKERKQIITFLPSEST